MIKHLLAIAFALLCGLAFALTPAQLATLRADINADATLSALANNGDTAIDIAAAYNATSNPAMSVWRTDAPVNDIYDAIDWTKYTPNDLADVTVIFSNRVLLVQTKQMNLQNMLTGRTTLNASKANIRAGLRDAVTALPSGTGGALVSPGGTGGATVLQACIRTATRAEKLFAGAPATTGPTTANLLVFEGAITAQDVSQARAN